MLTSQQVEQLRKGFRTYLEDTHPDWSNNTTSMHYDAFFAYNNNIGMDFWSCFLDDNSMKRARELISNYLRTENQSDRADVRANGYLKSMSYLKTFIDENYKDIPKNWRGKPTDSYLKTAFQNWLKNIKNSKGLPYKHSTISTYTGALKNSTAKLKLENIKQTDLFYYTSLNEFNNIYQMILAAPNFKEIDLAAGNAAYSIGLKLYLQFLEEREKDFNTTDRNETTNPPTSLQATYKKRYWIYAPGEGSRFWDEFYNNGIMGIGWDQLGDLKQYPSKNEMKTKMKEIYGEEFSYKNAGHATWQFANDIQIGDVIFVKKGIKKLIGRGIVTSHYIYDPIRKEYQHTRKVNWTHKGEWDHEGKIVLKALTISHLIRNTIKNLKICSLVKISLILKNLNMNFIMNRIFCQKFIWINKAIKL